MADDARKVTGPDGSILGDPAEEQPRERGGSSVVDGAAARALQRFSTQLASEPDSDALYAGAVDTAMEVMGADAASLQVFDPLTNALELVNCRNFHPAFAGYWKSVNASPESPCGQALRNNARIVIEDTDGMASTDATAAELRRSGLRAVQSTPLRSRSGRMLGMISTCWRGTRRLGETDFVLFDTLARLIADTIERAQVETVLRHGEARNAFLLRLGDTLRPLSDVPEIQDQAARLLGDYLNVDRCYCIETDAKAAHFLVRRDHVRGAAASVAGSWPIADWPVIARAFDSGERVIIPDASATGQLPASESAGLAALGIGAVVAVTLARHGRFVAALVVADAAPRAWTPAEIDLIGEVAERTWAAAERAHAGQRQKLLLAELQHRVRNLLATVRSMIQRSAQTSDTLEDFSMHLQGRIDSLARTQVVLARNPGAGIEVEDLVREELLSQLAAEEQVTVDGPEVHISPKAAEVLNLAIHELATNSLKYGALRDRTGRLAITWALDGRGNEPWLRFAWTESGVRVVAAAPRREGFGSELITRRVPYELAGTGTFELKPGGIHCVIEFPLRQHESVPGAHAASAPAGTGR